MKTEEIKTLVKEKYGEIAEQSSSGCGCGCSSTDYSIIGENYEDLEGYVADADLGLGCGIPTEKADIEPGDTVVDLGSGAGNDVFVARALVGDTGKVIGIDMTESMINKAVENNKKLGFTNVEFKLGEIEDMPLESDSTDVVISNCVLNLVPSKEKAFKEIHRILKPGGHFNISDIVVVGELPEKFREQAEIYAGCVGGALDKEAYLGTINDAGFKNIEIQKERKITIPEKLVADYLNQEDIEELDESKFGIFSVTVFAEK